MNKLHQIQFWEAVNRYATACGGAPESHRLGSVERMSAVAEVEEVVALGEKDAIDCEDAWIVAWLKHPEGPSPKTTPHAIADLLLKKAHLR